MREFDPDHTYTIEVKATTRRAVLARIHDTGIQMWLPRSQVTFPADLRRGDVVDVEIPAWLIRDGMSARR